MVSSEFTSFELERYSRQIRVDGFGLEGQRRLKASTVMVSRVGGVGGTIASLLARAGVGKLVLAHGGAIVPEYLNRMNLAVPADLARPCIEVFLEKIEAINPDVRLVPVPENVNEGNVAELVAQANLIADAAPLFEERYLMNREAVFQSKPLVTAAMYSTLGYVTSVLPGETPCLACIFPKKPDYWTDIKVFPAFGATSTLVGAIAALEAIKILSGFGQPLRNILWLFDLETNASRLLHVSRRPDCPVCGEAT